MNKQCICFFHQAIYLGTKTTWSVISNYIITITNNNNNNKIDSKRKIETEKHTHMTKNQTKKPNNKNALLYRYLLID